jgi:hypothetical protein
MTKRHKIAVVFAGALVLLGGAGALAAANPIAGPSTHERVVPPANGSDTPSSPDLPEPGDTPDAGD